MKTPTQIEIWIDWIDSTQESDLVICHLTDTPRILTQLTENWHLISRIQIVPFKSCKSPQDKKAHKMADELSASTDPEATIKKYI